MLSVYESLPHINFCMLQPIFMKLGMYIMAPEPISTAYFINTSQKSVCLHAYPPVTARQWYGKNVTIATNTHETIKMVGVPFSMQCMS
jgi:hypothetical protein